MTDSDKKRSSTTAFFTSPDPNEPRRLPRGLMVVVFSLATLVLLGVILKQLETILRPLLIAVFLSYLIMPAHRWLMRREFPSMASYIIIAVSVGLLLFGVGRMVLVSATDMNDKWTPVYEKKVDKITAWFERQVQWLEGTGPKEGTAEKTDDREPAEAGRPNSDRGMAGLLPAGTVKAWIGSVMGSFFTFIAMAGLIVFYLVFLIAERDSFQKRVGRVFGEERVDRVMDVVATINRAISEYIAVKTGISFTVAALSTLVMWVFGVDFFILWGVLTFLFNFIPYVGSIAAAGLPIGISILQFDSVWRMGAVAVLLAGVQVLTAYVIEPRVAGQKLDVSPLMILLALAFWGWLWGIVGMILAVPLLVIVKIILQNIDQTRPLAALMSHKP